MAMSSVWERCTPQKWTPRDDLLFVASGKGLSSQGLEEKGKKRLVKVLQKHDLSECKYLRYTRAELQDFVRERNITNTKTRLTKYRLIEILVQADEDATFPLLDLPATLRQLVLTFAVTTPEALVGVGKGSVSAIASASKLVRWEALPLFYSQNRFLVHITTTLVDTSSTHICRRVRVCKCCNSWLQAISHADLAEVRHLQFRMAYPIKPLLLNVDMGRVTTGEAEVLVEGEMEDHGFPGHVSAPELLDLELTLMESFQRALRGQGKMSVRAVESVAQEFGDYVLSPERW